MIHLFSINIKTCAYIPLDIGVLNMNIYCCRKLDWQPEFKFWIGLFVFHFALMPWGGGSINSFLFSLWGNCKVDWVLQPWLDNQSWRRKALNSNPVYHLRIDFVVEGFGKYMYSDCCFCNSHFLYSIKSTHWHICGSLSQLYPCKPCCHCD